MNPQPVAQAPALSPTERKTLALHRLEASRTQLIVHIYPKPPQRQRDAKDPSAPPPMWDGLAGLMTRAERNGFAQAAGRTARALARRWWTRQPWHASVDLVASTLVHEAKPIIRRHPWATLAAGGAAGATLVVVLPWAMRSLKAQAAPWRNNLGGMLWQQIAQAPVQLALAGALTAWISDISKRSTSQERKPRASTAPASSDPSPSAHAADRPPTAP
jgi:hypothetical protein